MNLNRRVLKNCYHHAPLTAVFKLAMIGMVLLGAALSTVIVTFAVTAPLLAAGSTVLELDRGEPYDAMAFHAGYLWVGQSRKDFNAHYELDVFDGQQKLVKSIALNHSLDHLYPYNDHAILIFGTAPEPNRRHYSIVSVRNGQFSVVDHTISMNAWGSDWLGTINGREYFSDFGGNSEDNNGGDLSRPPQTIYSVDRSGRAVFSKVRMRSPLNGIRAGDQLFIVHFVGLGAPARNIYRLNLSTGTYDEVFEQNRDRIFDLIHLDNNTLAVSEGVKSQIDFVDEITKEIKVEISVPGGARSMQKVGQCLVVGGELSKTVSIVSLKNQTQPTVVGSIDLSTTGDLFRGLRTLTVDVATGRVYGRSAYPCNPMTMKCEKTWNSVVVSSQADADLLKEKCF